MLRGGDCSVEEVVALVEQIHELDPPKLDGEVARLRRKIARVRKNMSSPHRK